MLYVQLDTNWPDNPKIIRAGWEAAGVHAGLMCLSKRLENDGWIDLALMPRYGVTEEILERLEANGLIEVNGAQIRPHDWLDRNPSQAAIDARREAKKAAGKRGNHERHHDGIPFDICPKCNPKPQVVAECEPSSSQVRDGAIAEPRTTTQTESQVEVTTASRACDEPSPLPRIPARNVEQARDQLAAIRAQRFGRNESGGAA